MSRDAIGGTIRSSFQKEKQLQAAQLPSALSLSPQGQAGQTTRKPWCVVVLLGVLPDRAAMR